MATCISRGCKREAGTRSICGRCSRLVPAEIWLAIHDHSDAWARCPIDLQPFIAWSWQCTLALAAHEATRYRFAKRHGQDPDATGRHWGLGPTGELEWRTTA